MNTHRNARAIVKEIYDIRRPFSNFQFIIEKLNLTSSIQRLFSLARTFGCYTLLWEEIPAKGIIADESREILELFEKEEKPRIVRLSFWMCTIENFDTKTSQDLIGYTILKYGFLGRDFQLGWHVFESIFRKNSLSHNCIHYVAQHDVTIDENVYSISGVMYCQQNGINKVCAHVAIRTILNRIRPKQDIAYSALNKVIGFNKEMEGLTVRQIEQILDSFNIAHFSFIKNESTISNVNQITKEIERILYSGIESGYGAMIAFDTSDAAHIIPLFGHTFDKDTWAPSATKYYFNIIEDNPFIPSSSWVGSFIGHDDNFGSDFCIPRLFIKSEDTLYATAILPKNVVCPGIIFEVISANIIYDIFRNLNLQDSLWKEILERSTIYKKNLVMRAIVLSKEEYISHFKEQEDWKFNKATDIKCIDEILLPNIIWMVEISIPHLFQVNKRKVAELVFDATMLPHPDTQGLELLKLIKLPSMILFPNSISPDGIIYNTIDIPIVTHTQLWIPPEVRT